MFQDKGNYIILLEQEHMRLQHTAIKKRLNLQFNQLVIPLVTLA